MSLLVSSVTFTNFAHAQMNPLNQTERANVDLVIQNLHKLVDALEELKKSSKNRQTIQEYDAAKQQYLDIVQNIEHKLANGQIKSVQDLDDDKNKKYRHDGQESSPKAAYCGDGKTQVKDANGNWVDCPQGTILVDKKIIDPTNGIAIDESTQDGWQKKWNLAHVLVHEKAHEIMIREQIAELQKQRWWNELPESEKNKRIAIATEHATTAEKHAQVYLVQKNLLKAYKEALKAEKKQLTDQKKALKNNAANREQIRQLESQISAVDVKIKWLDDTWRELQGSMRRAVRGSEFGHEHCGWPLDFHSGVAAITITFPAGFERFDLTVKNDDVTDMRITKTKWYGEDISIESEGEKPKLYMKMSDTVFSGQAIQPEVCQYLDWATQQGLILVSKNPISDAIKKDTAKPAKTMEPQGFVQLKNEIKELYQISKNAEKLTSILKKANDGEIKTLKKLSGDTKSIHSKSKNLDAKKLGDKIQEQIKDAESDKKQIDAIDVNAKKITKHILAVAKENKITKSDLDKATKDKTDAKNPKSGENTAKPAQSSLGQPLDLNTMDKLAEILFNAKSHNEEESKKTEEEIRKFIQDHNKALEEAAKQNSENKPDDSKQKDPNAPPESILDDIDTNYGADIGPKPDKPKQDQKPKQNSSIDHARIAQDDMRIIEESLRQELLDQVRDTQIQIDLERQLRDLKQKIVIDDSKRPIIQKDPIKLPETKTNTKPKSTVPENTEKPAIQQGPIITKPSNTKPTLSVPKQVTQEATGPSGANVAFSTSSQDKEDGVLTPVCNPASGTTFPIGATSVSCVVTDSNNNSVSGTFTVTVRDTTPPAFGPFQPTEGVKDDTGVQVFFDVTATDLVDGNTQVSCNYQSGYKFPPGVTELKCTTSDSRGNQSTKTVQITVTVTESGQ